MPLVKDQVARLWREGVRIFSEQFEVGSYDQGTVEPFDQLDDDTKYWAVLATTRNLLDSSIPARPNIYLEATTCAVFNFVADMVIHEYTWEKLAQAGFLKKREDEDYWRTLLIEASMAMSSKTRIDLGTVVDRAGWIRLVNVIKYSIVKRRDWGLMQTLYTSDREDAFALVGIPDDYFSLEAVLPTDRSVEDLRRVKDQLHEYVLGEEGLWNHTIPDIPRYHCPVQKIQPFSRRHTKIPETAPDKHVVRPTNKSIYGVFYSPVTKDNTLAFDTPCLPTTKTTSRHFTTPRGIAVKSRSTRAAKKYKKSKAICNSNINVNYDCPIKKEPRVEYCDETAITGKNERGSEIETGDKKVKTEHKNRPLTRLQEQIDILVRIQADSKVVKNNNGIMCDGNDL